MSMGIINLGNAEIEVINPIGGFPDQVKHVWNSLPSHAQDALVKLWTRPARNGIPRPNRFCFGEFDHVAATLPGGKTINFSRAALLAEGAQYVREIIAHEFAHVHDYSVGPSSMIDVVEKLTSEPRYELEMEEYAINIAAEWGYGLPGGSTKQEHMAIYELRVEAIIKQRALCEEAK